MKINKEYGVITSIKTNIKNEDIQKNVERFKKLMSYLTQEFSKEQFYNGDKLLSYAKEKELEIGDDFIVFPHNEGVALINVANYYGNQIDITPAISISTCNFVSGWTFERGPMSDVYVHAGHKEENLWIQGRDTMITHNLFMFWIMEKLEEYFYNDEIKLDDVREVNDRMVEILLFKKLVPEFEKEINLNSSKRINTLVVDGLSVKDYVKKNDIKSVLCTENDIFKICYLFKKPKKQVKQYIYQITS